MPAWLAGAVNNNNNSEFVVVMGHEWNVMNGVSETLFEQKKQKRVLPKMLKK